MNQPTSMSGTGFFVDVSDRSILSLKGSESLDLIQRMSTNDVSKLTESGVEQTVFTNEKGRIVEVVSLYVRQGNELLVIGQGTEPTVIKNWIEKFIIMENIVVEILTDDLIHFMVFDLPQNFAEKELRFTSPDVLTFPQELDSHSLYHVIAPKTHKELIDAEMTSFGFKKRELPDYEEYRILAGIPGFGTELSTSYNPLEVGLISLVSFTKGCYIGQEVIARLDTYQKVQRRLVRLAMNELPAELPAPIYLDQQEWGTITSAIKLSSHEVRGLGYVKTGSEESAGRLCFHKGTREIRIEVLPSGSQETQE